MTDPNVRAANEAMLARHEAGVCANAGFLPVAETAAHPTIVYRWDIEHRIAPMFLGTPLGGTWRSAFWVPAWVSVLFILNKATGLFNNALTTVQENKLKIAMVKQRYDEAAISPERQLVLLTEFQLSQSMDEWTALGVAAAIRRTHWDLDNK